MKPGEPPTHPGEPAGPNSLLQRLWRLPGQFLIFWVRLYQVAISPMLGPSCRFTPTCSNYFIQAVQKYGALRGGLKGLIRICRCHPWGGSGEDPP